MSFALKFYADPARYYDQTNNAVENLTSVLESCGPESTASLLDCIGCDIHIKAPGGYEIQPGDFMTMCFNDPRNFPDFRAIRSDIDYRKTPANRVPQLYPYVIKKCFGINANFTVGVTLEKIKGSLIGNCGVLVTLKNPGHYVGIVAYDTDTDEIIYNDPWPRNPWPNDLFCKTGFNRRVKSERMLANLKNYMVQIGV